MKISLHSHGACQEVTGSKHFLTIGNQTIQIDCGMFQGRREAAYKKNIELPFSPKDVSAIILSHGHFDHSGALPIMLKNGFSGNIYTTPASRDITNIILFDSAYIQKKDAEYLQEKAKKYPERNLQLYQPLYDTLDVIKTMNHFVTLNYHRPFLPVDGVEATLHDAGHILGSAMIHLKISNGPAIGFSGDLGRQNLPILRDPEVLPPVDYLVLEGTYGNRLHNSYGMAEGELRDTINRAVARGGKIIIPAFTIERTQELIYIIHLLMNRKQIKPIPIFIDSPMAVNATSIFKVHPECFDQETYNHFLSDNIDPFGFDQIKYVSSVKESKEINSVKGPVIIISASGMAENGRILHHLRNNLTDRNNMVAIVGFMAEHTLGRKLVEGFREVKIFGKMIKVAAEIVKLDAFSAHADYNEIKSWLNLHDLDRLKKIFLVHGEKPALIHLKEVLGELGISDIDIVETGLEYPLS